MFKKQRPAWAVTLLVGVASLVLSSCSGGTATEDTSAEASSAPKTWEEVIAAAKEEGTLTYYSNANDSGNNAIIAAFNEVYPEIKVNYTRLPDSTIAARIHQEANTGINAMDVVLTGQPEVMAGDGAIFENLTPDVLPAIADYPESALRFPWAVVTAQNTYAIAYNTSTVTEDQVPRAWEDVLNPEWKDQIQYAKPVGSATHMAWLEGMQHYFGDQYLTRFMEQNPTLVDSATPAAQAVGAGSGKLALIVYPSSVSELIDQGAPLKYVIPTPVLVKPSTMAIAKTPAHPNAARLFANFMLTPDGLSGACEATFTAASIPNVPGCIQIPTDAYQVKDLWEGDDALPYLNLMGLKPNS